MIWNYQLFLGPKPIIGTFLSLIMTVDQGNWNFNGFLESFILKPKVRIIFLRCDYLLLWTCFQSLKRSMNHHKIKTINEWKIQSSIFNDLKKFEYHIKNFWQHWFSTEQGGHDLWRQDKRKFWKISFFFLKCCSCLQPTFLKSHERQVSPILNLKLF